jgi:hypothetical protein
MPNGILTETQFFSLVSTITNKHNCRLLDINKRIINITGPSESEYACTTELENILRQHLVDST